MLERIIVRQHRADPTDSPIDMGALVEAMLFYGQTELVLSEDRRAGKERRPAPAAPDYGPGLGSTWVAWNCTVYDPTPPL